MISNPLKIYNKLCEIYPSALETVSNLSFNSDGNKNFIISDEIGFNFDKVYNLSACHPDGKKEKSPDCLFLVDDILYFVEFKEGKAKKDDIRMKIHEGITTLFCFVLKHLPDISREEFFKLDIRYTVIMRDFRAQGRDGFLQDLEAISNKFNIKNIEGFLVTKALVKDSPQRILEFLNKVSSGRIVQIQITAPDNASLREFTI
ncbi:hypothetical protein MXL39_03050 [Enterobacter sichuanensis]|uniref:hypothetical protein n=1 Tax=Enterobacter sichuanensis TaxID=2071710 RepID=UPI002DBB1C65|nr:hypothetical protein [Enterobacter sichuanensis]MEB5959223.1 hypothetical protein [Enterobacter sichuanensis]